MSEEKSYQEKSNIVVLVSMNKTKYIVLDDTNEDAVVTTNFNIKNGMAKPCLTLNNQKILRAQRLLKQLPSVFTINSRDKYFNIDSITKILEFEKDADMSGIIQFQINKKTLEHKVLGIYEEIDTEIQYVEMKEENVPIGVKLNVISICLDNTLPIVSITDSVEKIILISIIPKTGYVGTTDISQFGRIMIVNKYWPELELELNVFNGKISIYSRLIQRLYADDDINCIVNIRIHKNFIGIDLGIKMTHISASINLIK